MAGKTLGSYRLEVELGSGAMGRVYRATGPAGTVAVKVVHPHLLESPGFFKRFLREAELGKSVVHPNVVRTLDCDALGTDHFLVMEYVEGQTLRGLLEELARVPEELCRHIGREMAKGLSAIHAAGAVHRDLKPENVLITKDHAVKIMDLGVARLADEALRLSRSGAFVGSVQYASPEQFGEDAEAVDGRSDLWSLGVILYELSCGEHPFPGDSFGAVLSKVVTEEPRRLGERNPQLSAFFEEVVHALLSKDRAKRFASAAEFCTVLQDGEKSGWWAERAKAIRAATRRPLRRIRIPRETAVYGRDAELARLRSLYDTAKAGDGQVVLIEGEAGIGKTRLMDEFVGRLRAEGEDVNFLFGSYPPGGAATASGAWSTAYREQFGSEDLEDTLKGYLSITPVLIPAFAALLRGEPAPEGKEPLTKDSIHTVFVHATRALAAERPTIVLIEDLHFAPEEGRGMFAALALAVPDHRILLVGTSRPGLPEAWRANVERLEQASRMELARLGPKDLTRLLIDAFHSERLAEELAFKIAQKSDGNPFFVFEIIRGLREGQFITRKDDGTWVTTKVIHDVQVPSSVLDLIAARVSDLDDAEHELLDVAACCGFAFDAELVAEVAGQPVVAALRRMAHLEGTHRLVRASGDHFVFDHHQVQETLYARLPPQLVRRYHAAIAETLERRGPPAGSVAVDVCEHYFRGNREARALLWLDAALTHLEKGYLNDRAIALAERALAAPAILTGAERVRLLLRLAARLDLLGRRGRQETALTEAVALADAGGDPKLRAKTHQALGWLFFSTSRLAEAERLLRAALDFAHAAGDLETEGRATGNLGSMFWRRGRYEEARAHIEKHLALAREIGDRRGEASANGNLGLVLSDQGRYEEARIQLERQLALAREVGDRRFEANATGNLGIVFQSQGRYEEARARYEGRLALAREIGDRQGEASATGNLGIVFQSQGRCEEARAQYDKHLALAREIGDRRGEAYATGNLGTVFQSQGRYEEALAQHEQQLALAREIGDRRGEGIATGNLGVVFSDQGRYEEARAQFDKHLALAREVGHRQSEGVATGNLGSLFWSLGRYEKARAQYEQRLALAREIGDRRQEGYALAGLGDLAEGADDPETARRRYGEALALRRALGEKPNVAASLAALGELDRRSGNAEDAAALLDDAVALAREVATRDVLVLATARRALLPGGDLAAALAAFTEHGDRIPHRARMEARFLLFQSTGDRAHLAEAKRLLDFAVEHSPEDCRESMLRNVRLHREINTAAKEAGL